MATISKLVVSLQANSAKLVTELKKSRGAVANFVDAAKKKAQKLKKTFAPIAGAIGAITKAALAGAGALAGFVTAIAFRASTLRQLDTLSRSLGISVEALQQWQYAGKSVGIEADKMGDIFKDVSDKLGDFLVTGGGAAADLFDQLGLSIKDFVGLSPDQALLKIGKAIEPLTQQEKVFFLEAIAGDAAYLLPLLDRNAEAFRKFSAEAEKAGLIIDSKAVSAATRFSTSIDNLLVRSKAFWSHLTGQLSGPLDVLTQEIIEWVDSFGGVDQAAKKAAGFVLEAIRTILTAGAGLITFFANLDTYLAKIELRLNKLLLIEDKFAKYYPAAMVGRLFTGEDIDKQIAEREKKIADLESDIKNNNEAAKTLEDFQAEAQALYEKMVAGLNDPVDDNTDSNNDNTDATGKNTDALGGVEAALNRYRQNQLGDNITTGSGGTGVVDTDRIFGRASQDNLKSSKSFEDSAKRFSDSIKAGYITADSATTSVALLQRHIATLALDNARLGGENFDIEGMKAVVDQLAQMAKDQLEGKNAPVTLQDYQAMFERAAQAGRNASIESAQKQVQAIEASTNDIVRSIENGRQSFSNVAPEKSQTDAQQVMAEYNRQKYLQPIEDAGRTFEQVMGNIRYQSEQMGKAMRGSAEGEAKTFNSLNQPQTQSMGSLTLELMGDGKNLSGKVLADPAFIREVKQLAREEAASEARAVDQ
ncbi:hypothetical protein ACFVYJ_01580 [Pontibacter sp. JAM-7]|uniref:hypothetical protein n=1 Tax=Pontibacter sp. JAM-7 TaxID=3366581 RepID=UPI003AF45561